MDEITAQSVNDELQYVISFGGHISTAFHQYALNRAANGCFESSRTMTDAALSSLKQISHLLQDEAQYQKEGTGKALFSYEGLSYTRGVVKECAKSLVKTEQTVRDGCLPRKELNAKRRKAKKSAPVEVEIVCSDLEIDEKAFLNQLEKTRWPRIDSDIRDIMDRVDDLQLRLVLVHQVVTVGLISSDLSSGRVDVQEIVSFHDRIHRTAELAGIKLPKKRVSRRASFSDSYDSGSDSGVSPRKSPVRERVVILPSPPPMPSGLPRIAPPPPPVSVLPKPQITENVNPPSYTEKPNSAVLSSTKQTALPIMAIKLSDEKKEPPENASVKEQRQQPVKSEVVLAKPATPEPRLFAAKPHGVGFKLRSLFRSKESLAAEIRKVLCDTDSHLLAFVIQSSGHRLIPHSAFHSLESTHMKTILAQLNDDTWYTAYTSLNQQENMMLRNIIYPWVNGKTHERDIVALKVVQEQAKPNAWLALLREFRPKNERYHGPPQAPLPGRVLLAIVREQLVNGKPLLPASSVDSRMGPVLQPPGPPRPPVTTEASRRLPHPPQFLRPPPPPSFSNPPSGSNRVYDITNYNRGPPSPTVCGPPPPSSVPPPPGARLVVAKSIRISDMNVFTDRDAAIALTSYNEYTMRTCEPAQPSERRSWLRVSNTLESSDKDQVQDRVDHFLAAGKSVIEVKMRLTEDQAAQVTRLMDELIAQERDTRFEWSWVELSVYDNYGELPLFANGPGTISSRATQIHLIAKRSLKQYIKAMDVHNSLMTRGPGPYPPSYPYPPGPGPRPITLGPPSPPPFRQISPVIVKAPRSRRRYVSSDSDSSSSDSGSSDSSVPRRMRRRRVRRQNRRSGRKITYDSDDSDDEDAEVDVMEIDLMLKRGDDLVQKLLKKWTPQNVGGKKNAA
ncbi:hypothetical protein HYALB_00004487 [Hymenoscyphus albidus]|uniref:Uncharacterized protein n=1 Tax=Hymenoscyphus albidus TaxID=595503 RepID=A0A9N9LWN2_9HELO|nr:hypothetical protein HYALB_00004487 [Hymenoscyphus albidus]